MKKRFLQLLLVGGLLSALLVLINPLFLAMPLLLTGYWRGPYSDSPFLEAHQRAVKTFVESEDLGIARFRKAGLWNESSILFESAAYRPDGDGVRLIGLTPEKGDRYFESWRLRKDTLAEATPRELSAEEAVAVARIRTEQLPWIRVPTSSPYLGISGAIRVIAPVNAESSCLECHHVKEGSLLGAFDYWLIPISR